MSSPNSFIAEVRKAKYYKSDAFEVVQINATDSWGIAPNSLRAIMRLYDMQLSILAFFNNTPTINICHQPQITLEKGVSHTLPGDILRNPGRTIIGVLQSSKTIMAINSSWSKATLLPPNNMQGFSSHGPPLPF
ncbi:hypothetical protein J1N35_015376 [Gossypium stocksii]|uniref:Uncharacterized protein n=1 Tax=Gossypium stocksii TaxID=47602 RepID=A0A9D3VW29_9ROSI|nr:hypothetical protein J1N35_015376 [Gossypium stocksii]